ncbi:MAG: substrate-binding domain-containing protein [Tepidisphaeraceae bacterium]|jgi:LacI family transcriptional regulator
MTSKSLKPVVAQPGRPLYLTVKEHVREAIDAGVFRPGEQMPSTKMLSERLEVSLVTAHRALQELVDSGVLHRAQGKGTFIQDRYLDRSRRPTTYRIGILLDHGLSLENEYYATILDGIRHASHDRGVELLMMREADDTRRECAAFIALDAVGETATQFGSRLTRRQPLVTAGAPAVVPGGASVRIDSRDMAWRALDHLRGLGHERVAYFGGSDRTASEADRWAGFQDACAELGVAVDPAICLHGSNGGSTEKEGAAAIRILTGPRKPTAVLASGYRMALNAYSAANLAGLRVPEDLSVIGIGDALGASNLAPPLTVLREPLAAMGQAAVTILCERLEHPESDLGSRQFTCELVARRSCASQKR